MSKSSRGSRRATARRTGRLEVVTRRPWWRRASVQVRLALGFGLVVAISLALLGYTAWRAIDDHDWHASVTIDGVAINRAEARNRLAILTAIDAARAEVINTLVLKGTMTAAEQSAVLAATTTADYTTATVDSLVREHAVRQEAATAGVTVGDPDPRAVLASVVAAPFARHIRWFEISGPLPAPDTTAPSSAWPGAPAGSATGAGVLAARATAMTRAASLAGTTKAADLVTAARAAGWDARGGEVWIADVDPVEGVPAVTVAALRDPSLAKGGAVGPTNDDVSGGAVLGVLLDTALPPEPSAIDRAIAGIKLDDGALRTWAQGVELELTLRAAKLQGWSTTPSTLVTARELVVGPSANAGGAGPYVGLAHLVLSSLPASELPTTPDPLPSPFGGPTPVPTPWPTVPGTTQTPALTGSPSPVASPSAAGQALAARLMALPPDQRLARWDALVAEANATVGTADPMRHSGELGWANHDGLIPAVADAVLVPGASPGSIVGPIETAAGPELFLVRGHFLGSLDDHASAVLGQITTTRDLSSLAARIAPGAEGLRYDPGITRSELELVGNDPARGALVTAAIGSRSDPYILDGEILVGNPMSRQQAVPSGQVLARVRVEAFALWISDRMAQHEVIVDRDPFGLAASPTPTPAASSTAGVPTMAAPPSVGLPGVSVAPRSSDPFAPPTIPGLP